MAGHYVAVAAPQILVQNRPKLPMWRLLCLTVSFLGVQFGWAIQIAFTTPLFRTLGLTNSQVAFVWLAGPISGFAVQPTVGALSDRYSRRTPFILLGGICIIIGLALISNASLFAGLIAHEHAHIAAVAIAIAGFWILDLSNNTVQGPCRALLVDLAPPEQQATGSSCFSFMLGAGNLLGYMIGSIQLMHYVPFMGTQYRALFTLSMIVLVVCIGITLLTTKDQPNAGQANQQRQNPFVAIFNGIKSMPPAVQRVCWVQFFSWISWFTFILYITDWVGEHIYHGSPTADKDSASFAAYNDGVRYASRALCFNALVTMIASVCVPRIVTVVGIKAVYFTSQIILAACLISTYWINTHHWALAIIIICGIPWTVTMVLPFAIVGQAVSVEEGGLFMGVLNIFVVLPQICVSLLVPVVIKMFDHNIVSALVTGGIFSVIAALFALRLITPPPRIVEVNPNLLNNPALNENENDPLLVNP